MYSFIFHIKFNIRESRLSDIKTDKFGYSVRPDRLIKTIGEALYIIFKFEKVGYRIFSTKKAGYSVIPDDWSVLII